MAGKKLTDGAVTRLASLLRSYEAGELGVQPGGGAEAIEDPRPMVALLHSAIASPRGNDSWFEGEGVGAALNLTDRANDAIPCEPVPERVQWIRVVGSELTSFPTPQAFQIRNKDNGQIANLSLYDTPLIVKEKLIGIGLPDDILVCGKGDKFEDGVLWNECLVWAVLMPGTEYDTSRDAPLEWYDNPSSGAQLVARVDAIPMWPRLERVFVWKALPAADVIPAGSFVTTFYWWGRGHMVTGFEAVL